MFTVDTSMTDSTENKCDLCGLRVEFDQSNLQQAEKVEDFFKKLRSLQRKKLVPKGWPKVVSVSIGIKNPDDRSEICAVNHSSWRKNEKKCPYWQPRVGLALGEHLALHEARKVESLTKDIHKLTAVAALIPIIYLIREVYEWYS